MTALAELVAKTPAERELARATGWRGFGLLLASYRATAKLSLTVVSERTGIEWPRLRRLERGLASTPPTVLELESLAAVFGVSARPLVERASRVRRGEG